MSIFSIFSMFGSAADRGVISSGPKRLLSVASEKAPSAGDGLLQISHQRLVAFHIGICSKQRVSSPRKHPAQRPDALCSSRTMPTSLLSSRPARETRETTFAKPVATSLDTLSARRWPDCPPEIASRSCRPSPAEQVHLHHGM